MFISSPIKKKQQAIERLIERLERLIEINAGTLYSIIIFNDLERFKRILPILGDNDLFLILSLMLKSVASPSYKKSH